MILEFGRHTLFLFEKHPPKSLAISKIFRNLKLRMKRSSPLSTWVQICALIAAFAALSSANCATPGYGPPQEQESGFGTKVGGFFRSLFYGESSRSRQNDAPGPPQRGKRGGYSASSSQTYNLDTPPSDMGPRSRGVEPVAKDNADDLPPPPPSRTKDGVKPKNEPKAKPKTEPVVEKKTPERSVTTPATNTPDPKPAFRETTPSPTITNKLTVPPPPVKEREPEPSTPPTPRNTPGANETVEPKDNKIAQNSAAPSKPAVVEKKEVLTATKTANPARVKSPYPPYTELDVSGLPSGSSALDPTCQRIFRVP